MSRIYGGERTTYPMWPWIVFLYNTVRNSRGSGNACGGTFISSDWILTAGHCIKDENPSAWLVTVGVTDFIIEDGKPISSDDEFSRYRVLDVIRHPSYDERGRFYKDGMAQMHSNNDVALIRVAHLDGPVRAVPICLPHGEKPTAAQRCYVAGYGKEEWGAETPLMKLKEGLVPIATNSDCLKSYPGIKTDQLLCAGTPDGEVDACQVDSGGPLVCQRCESCSFYLAGVVSFGYKCGETYGVYSRVSYYQDWINQVTQGAISPASSIKECPYTGGCDDNCKSFVFEQYHFFDSGEEAENGNKIYKDAANAMYLIPVIDESFSGWVVHSKTPFSWETPEDFKYITKLGSQHIRCPNDPEYSVYSKDNTGLSSRIRCSVVERPTTDGSTTDTECCQTIKIHGFATWTTSSPLVLQAGASINGVTSYTDGSDTLYYSDRNMWIIGDPNNIANSKCYNSDTSPCPTKLSETFNCYSSSWLPTNLKLECVTEDVVSAPTDPDACCTEMIIENHGIYGAPDPYTVVMDGSDSQYKGIVENCARYLFLCNISFIKNFYYSYRNISRLTKISTIFNSTKEPEKTQRHFGQNMDI